MPRWPINQVDKLIEATLSNDATIKSLMGGKARVAGYRIPRDKNWFPFIFFYCIPGPVAPGQGTTVIQFNPEYAIETRTVGAPTDESEAIVERVDFLIGTMVKQLTPDGNWVVSARLNTEINQVQQGETGEVFYMRRGGNYKLAVVRS
jgi:hypothetical protein